MERSSPRQRLCKRSVRSSSDMFLLGMQSDCLNRWMARNILPKLESVSMRHWMGRSSLRMPARMRSGRTLAGRFLVRTASEKQSHLMARSFRPRPPDSWIAWSQVGRYRDCIRIA